MQAKKQAVASSERAVSCLPYLYGHATYQRDPLRRELALGGHLGWRAQYGVDWRHDPAKGGRYTRWSPSYRESERSTAEYGRSIGVHVDVTSDGDSDGDSDEGLCDAW